LTIKGDVLGLDSLETDTPDFIFSEHSQVSDTDRALPNHPSIRLNRFHAVDQATPIIRLIPLLRQISIHLSVLILAPGVPVLPILVLVPVFVVFLVFIIEIKLQGLHPDDLQFGTAKRT
jgi:hypothetical protein